MSEPEGGSFDCTLRPLLSPWTLDMSPKQRYERKIGEAYLFMILLLIITALQALSPRNTKNNSDMDYRKRESYAHGVYPTKSSCMANGNSKSEARERSTQQNNGKRGLRNLKEGNVSSIRGKKCQTRTIWSKMATLPGGAVLPTID